MTLPAAFFFIKKKKQATTNHQITLYACGPTPDRLGSLLTALSLTPSIRWFLTNHKLILCLLIISVCPCHSIQVSLLTFFDQSVLINGRDLQHLLYCKGDVAPFSPARHTSPITFLSSMLSHSVPPPNQAQPPSRTHLFYLPTPNVFPLLPLVLQVLFTAKI